MTPFEWTEFVKTAQARVAALDPQTLGILVLLGVVGIVSIFRREMQTRLTRRLSSALDSYAEREIERMSRRDPRESGVRPHPGSRRRQPQLATEA
jgi:hypothetical protein